MDLTHRFTVPASIDDTWDAFNDLESIAPCFPGATVASVEGDDFTGSVKVKLGPIALVYTGTGQFIERDNDTHRAVIEARGKDKRGNGTASATVTATLTANIDGTEVEVVTDLAITGKPAQFGRGVIQDVSDKLLGQFVNCISGKLGEGPLAAGTAEKEPSEAATPATGPSADEVALGAAPASSATDPDEEPDFPEEEPSPGPGSTRESADPAAAAGATRTHSRPSAASSDMGELNMLSTIGGVLLKRYGPFLLSGIGLLLIILRLTRKVRAGH